jgi:anti-anti-sigma factor
VLSSELRIESDMTELGTLTMRIVGVLDADTAHRVDEALAEWLGISELVIDLSGCTFVDSDGISALLTCRHELAGGASLRLVGVHPNLEHTLRLAGLDTILGLNASAA